MHSRQIVLFSALLLASGVAQATVYRWTSADGMVHFGQTPPPGAHARPFDPDAPPPPGNAGAQKALQSYVDRVQAQLANQAKKASQRDRRKARAEALAHNCELAKQQRDKLAQGNAHRIIQVGTDGKAHRLTESERKQELAQLARRIRQYCGSPGHSGG